jgi:hypothetical protein
MVLTTLMTKGQLDLGITKKSLLILQIHVSESLVGERLHAIQWSALLLREAPLVKTNRTAVKVALALLRRWGESQEDYY